MRQTGRNLQPDVKPPGQFPILSTLARDPKAKSSKEWEKARGPSIALLPSCLHWPVLFFLQADRHRTVRRRRLSEIPASLWEVYPMIVCSRYFCIYIYICNFGLSISDCMRLLVLNLRLAFSLEANYSFPTAFKCNLRIILRRTKSNNLHIIYVKMFI